jgi:hypothetical protein
LRCRRLTVSARHDGKIKRSRAATAGNTSMKNRKKSACGSAYAEIGKFIER